MFKPTVRVVPGPWPHVRIAFQRDGRDAIVVIVDPAAATGAAETSLKAWLWIFGPSTVRKFNEALSQARRSRSSHSSDASKVPAVLEDVGEQFEKAVDLVDAALDRAKALGLVSKDAIPPQATLAQGVDQMLEKAGIPGIPGFLPSLAPKTDS